MFNCGVRLTVECGVCLTMPCGHVLGCVRALCLHRYTENHRSCFGVKTGTVLGCVQFWGVLSFGVLCLLLTPLCHTFCFKSGSRKSVRIKPLGVLMEHISSCADRKGSLMSQGQSSICKTPHS